MTKHADCTDPTTMNQHNLLDLHCTTNWDHGWMVFFVVFGEDLQVTTLRQMQFHCWGHISMQWYLANMQSHVITKQNDNHCWKIIAVKCCQSVSNPSGIGRFLMLGSCFFHVAAASLEGPSVAWFAYTDNSRWSITKSEQRSLWNPRPYRYTKQQYKSCYPDIPGAESLRFSYSNPQEAWTGLNVPFKLIDMR